MSEKQFITMLGLVIVPQVAELIARDSKLTEVLALRAFCARRPIRCLR